MGTLTQEGRDCPWDLKVWSYHSLKIVPRLTYIVFVFVYDQWRNASVLELSFPTLFSQPIRNITVTHANIPSIKIKWAFSSDSLEMWPFSWAFFWGRYFRPNHFSFWTGILAVKLNCPCRSGISDSDLRVKVQLWKPEHAAAPKLGFL